MVHNEWGRKNGDALRKYAVGHSEDAILLNLNSAYHIKVRLA